MKRSFLSRSAFAILVALPLLPVGGIVLNAPPVVVFSLGATAFFIAVLLIVALLRARAVPPAGSAPAAVRFRFPGRDLLCLTAHVLGMAAVVLARLRGGAAERASRPGALRAAGYARLARELQPAVVRLPLGGL